MGGIYLRVWTEASKIIFEGMLHCDQLKKNEMTGALSSTLTVRVITKRRWSGEEWGGSFQVWNLCCMPASHVIPVLIWVAVQILIASFLSCIQHEHIVLSTEKERRNTKSPVYHDRVQQNWYIYSRFQYKWGLFCFQGLILYKSNWILEFCVL